MLLECSTTKGYGWVMNYRYVILWLKGIDCRSLSAYRLTYMGVHRLRVYSTNQYHSRSLSSSAAVRSDSSGYDNFVITASGYWSVIKQRLERLP